MSALEKLAASFGGTADSQDAVVVLHAGQGDVAGKFFVTDEDGKPAKKQAANRAQYTAVQVGVPDVGSMAALLRFIGEHPAAALMVGRFPDPPAGANRGVSGKFKVVSARKAVELGGEETGWFISGKNVATIARNKNNAAPSSWLLLDRDFTDCQPEHLRLNAVEDWWAAMCAIAPGLAGCGRVDWPSSSTRLLGADGKPLFPSPSSHHFVQLTDAEEMSTLGARMLTAAMLSKYGWKRMWGGKPTRAWSIFDPSTFSWERLSFDGAPKTSIAETSIAPPDVRVGCVGGRFDASTVPMPDEADRAKLERTHGLRIETGGAARVATLRDDKTLRLDSVLTVKRPDVGEWTGTVQDLWIWAAMQPGAVKLRAQAPFRESDSWAGIFRYDGTAPMAYDVGPQVSFHLNKADRAGPPPELFLETLKQIGSADDP